MSLLRRARSYHLRRILEVPWWRRISSVPGKQNANHCSVLIERYSLCKPLISAFASLFSPGRWPSVRCCKPVPVEIEDIAGKIGALTSRHYPKRIYRGGNRHCIKLHCPMEAASGISLGFDSFERFPTLQYLVTRGHLHPCASLSPALST